MKMLRNPEIKKSLLCYLILTLILSVGAFLISVPCGIYVLCACLLFVAIYLLIMHRRCKRIAELSERIDRILHGENDISFEAYTEGELGVLQSEISKMTVRLREQQQRLIKDKVYLADSIADISHQIRTPLTSINLIVDFLSQPELDEQRRMELVHELDVLLSRIDWLIVALLKISKLDAGTAHFQAEEVALADLVAKAVSPVLIPIELKEQTLEISAEGSFVGDLSWTSEALGNIVKNCMEHTPTGGRIEIAARETPLYAEITVSDSGNGIDADDLPHVFERFYKGKNSSGNSFGIGLALARMIVTSQNGTLKAENKPGGGAKFTMRFYKGAV